MSKNKTQNVASNSQVRSIFLKSGPNAIRLKPAEVEPSPQAPRGRPSEGIRPVLRKRNGQDVGIYYIHGDGKPYSTGLRGDDPTAAYEAQRRAHDAAIARALGHVAPKEITVSDIIEAEKKLIDPGKDATGPQISAFFQRVKKLERMADFFGRETPAQRITPELCRAYEADMCSKPARPGTKSTSMFKPGTVRVDLAWWRRGVRRYYTERNMPCSINVYLPERPESRINWCDRDDIAVLVASAIFGWHWDRNAVRTITHVEKHKVTGKVIKSYSEERQGDWVTEEVEDIQTGKMVRRRVVEPSYRCADTRARGRMLARAILIAFYTGTRIGRLRYLTWERHLYYGWVDVMKGEIRRSGLHSGEWAGPGRKRKKAGAARLPSAIYHLFRLWEASDKAKGFKFILHQPCGSVYLNSNSITSRLKQVGKRCGYPDIIMHEMRHSAVTVLLLNGAAPLDVANYVGMSLEMVLKVYNHVSTQGTRPGAALMGVKGGRDRRSAARDQVHDKPREMMTPAEVAAAYGMQKMKSAAFLTA